jgi:hypothetical protein
MITLMAFSVKRSNMAFFPSPASCRYADFSTG